MQGDIEETGDGHDVARHLVRVIGLGLGLGLGLRLGLGCAVEPSRSVFIARSHSTLPATLSSVCTPFCANSVSSVSLIPGTGDIARYSEM